MAGGLSATAILILLSEESGLLNPLAPALIAGSVLINLSSPKWQGFSLTGNFVLFNFAAIALGPGPAATIVVGGELGAYVFDRIRPFAVGLNIASGAIPAYMVGWMAGTPLQGGLLRIETVGALAGASVAAMVVNGAFIAAMGWYDGLNVRSVYRLLQGHLAIQLLTVPVIVGLAAAYVELGELAAVVLAGAILGFNHTVGLMIQARRMADRAAVIAASRQRLVAQALDAEDRERRRLAERLHDEAIQSLLVAQHDLADDDPNVREKAADAVGQAIADLRGAVFDLHPAVLDHAGLAGAVQAVAEQQGRRGAFEASVEVDHAAEGLNDELAFTLARELLVNAGRHAQAANVTVRIGRRDDAVSLDVVDDGVGISDEAREQAVLRGHIGLASSRERVEVLGGSFELQTAPGEGTSVRIVIPRAQAPREVAMPETTQSILAARRPAPERPRAAT